MSNLSNYIDKLKKFQKANPDLSEEELIMYVYLDLGLRFKFDQEFFFGGSKTKKNLYEKSNRIDTLEECLKSNKLICRSGAYLMQYILRELGVNIRTIVDPEDLRKYKHVYNIITPKNGGEEYSIDLQEDMINMHFHAFTKDFGLATDGTDRLVISREEQKKMHQKFGYVSDKNPYIDEYIYLIKQHIGLFDTYEEKIDFLLSNIDPIEYPNVDYWERRWKHERFLKKILTQQEMSKLNSIEFYKEKDDGSKEFINGFAYEGSKGVIVYMYSKADNKYNSYSVKEVAQMVKNEGLCNLQKIKGLNSELMKLKNDEAR